MYHYVRDNENYNYDCYARRKCEFEAQINYFRKSSEIVDPGDLDKIKYYLCNRKKNAYLLTFDDGYKDHLYCSEFLNNLNLKAVFFPPISAIEGNLLDVNLIHILLGLRKFSKKELLNEIIVLCQNSDIKIDLEGEKVYIDEYINKFKNDSIFDNKINQIIKKILQRDIINQPKRTDICRRIFNKFNDGDLKKYAFNLYLNKEEMIKMKKLGMYFGSHGLNHLWLEKLEINEQYKEIKESFEYLKKISLISCNDPLIMCFPFGSYNQETISILKKLNVNYSLTTKNGSASINSKNSIYELKRWDTNHFWNDEFRKPGKDL
tara:strand:- start:1253 stop:2212 length:960 start_codon:yes stop_codon:yes gene_type:complete